MASAAGPTRNGNGIKFHQFVVVSASDPEIINWVPNRAVTGSYFVYSIAGVPLSPNVRYTASSGEILITGLSVGSAGTLTIVTD